MGVKRSEDGKYKRITSVEPDPLRIVCTRGIKRNAVETRNKLRHSKKSNVSSVKILKCISMWKNPTGQVVPLRTRIVHTRFNDFQPEINTQMFMELKSSLDKVEHSSGNQREIKEDICGAEVEEIVE